MSRLPRDEAQARLRDPRVFRFTFVRNPWTRLVSGYLDKVLGAEPVARSTIRRHYRRSLAGRVNWRLHRLTGRLDRLFQRGFTFRQFVMALASEPPETINPHFKPQTQILKGIPLDLIGRIENFAEDFAAIQRRIGDATPAAVEHVQQYAPPMDLEPVADWSADQLRSLDAFPDWRRFYPLEVAEMVRDIFADDFEVLGYSWELAPLSRAA